MEEGERPIKRQENQLRSLTLCENWTANRAIGDDRPVPASQSGRRRVRIGLPTTEHRTPGTETY